MLPPPPTSTLFPYTTLFRSLSSKSQAFIYALLRFACFLSPNFSISSNVYPPDRKSTRLNSSHVAISYAVFCLKKKKKQVSDQEHCCQHRRAIDALMYAMHGC